VGTTFAPNFIFNEIMERFVAGSTIFYSAGTWNGNGEESLAATDDISKVLAKSSTGEPGQKRLTQAHRHNRAFGDSASQIFFVPPNLAVSRKIGFKHTLKTKILPP